MPVAVGRGVNVAVGGTVPWVAVGEDVAVAVGDTVAVSVGPDCVCVGVAVAVGGLVPVGDGVTVEDTVPVGTPVGEGVGVALADAVPVGMPVGVAVGVSVGFVSIGKTTSPRSAIVDRFPASSTAANAKCSEAPTKRESASWTTPLFLPGAPLRVTEATGIAAAKSAAFAIGDVAKRTSNVGASPQNRSSPGTSARSRRAESPSIALTVALVAGSDAGGRASVW